MNIHEYQAKALLQAYGAPVAEGHVAETPQQAAAHARTLGGESFVVKAQIHAGGRGKGGGIKLVKTLEELHAEADRMLGKPLITPQTGPKGRVVRRVYVVKDATIARELYLSLLVDRGSGRVAFVASTEGGVDIEAVAANTPEKIVTLTVDPASGISDFHGRVIASALKLQGPLAKQCAALVRSLYTLFVEKDASLIEINPLIVTKDGNLLASTPRSASTTTRCSATRTSLRCAILTRKTPPRSRPASSTSLMSSSTATSAAWSTAPVSPWRPWTSSSSMAASPPTSSTSAAARRKEQVTEAFKIILSDPHVKGILVNIFGGIMRCDIIAEGIIAAAKRDRHSRFRWSSASRAPMSSAARRSLRDSGLAIIPADDLDDAAKKAVAAVKAAA